jgi:hypothetical protein
MASLIYATISKQSPLRGFSFITEDKRHPQTMKHKH